MAQDISLSAGVRTNLLSLQQTSSLIDRTAERLATGKKVNSPIDNPTNFFAAVNLSDRADGLNQRLDGIGQAVQQVKAADNGIESIRSILSQMSAVVNNALAQTDSGERRELGKQFNELLVQATSIAKDSGYQGVNFLQGNETQTVQFAEDFDASTLDVKGFNIAGPGGTGKVNASTGELTAGSIQGASYASGASVAGLSSVASQAAVTSLASIASLASVASAGTAGTAASIAARASVAAVASQASIASQASRASVASTTYQASLASVGSQASQAATASRASVASAASVASKATGASRASVAARVSYASVASQASYAAVASTASRASYASGYNNYAFTIDSGTTQTSAVKGIRSFGLDSTGINGYEIDWGASNYKTTLKTVVTAIEAQDSELRTKASTLASNLSIITLREDFTNNLINVLEEGADKLILADLNEEGANLVALQTASSLATQSLSLASQQSQQVLQLIG